MYYEKLLQSIQEAAMEKSAKARWVKEIFKNPKLAYEIGCNPRLAEAFYNRAKNPQYRAIDTVTGKKIDPFLFMRRHMREYKNSTIADGVPNKSKAQRAVDIAESWQLHHSGRRFANDFERAGARSAKRRDGIHLWDGGHWGSSTRDIVDAMTENGINPVDAAKCFTLWRSGSRPWGMARRDLVSAPTGPITWREIEEARLNKLREIHQQLRSKGIGIPYSPNPDVNYGMHTHEYTQNKWDNYYYEDPHSARPAPIYALRDLESYRHIFR